LAHTLKIIYVFYVLNSDPNLDGIDQWESLKTGGPSKRTEFVYNIDDKKPEVCGHAAIRLVTIHLLKKIEIKSFLRIRVRVDP
jgi:hypothetical protein